MGFCSIILALYLFYVRDSNLGRFRPMMPRCLKSCLPFWKDTFPGFKILVWQSLFFPLIFQLMQFQSLVNILRGKLAEYWAQFPLFLSTSALLVSLLLVEVLSSCSHSYPHLFTSCPESANILREKMAAECHCLSFPKSWLPRHALVPSNRHFKILSGFLSYSRWKY